MMILAVRFVWKWRLNSGRRDLAQLGVFAFSSFEILISGVQYNLVRLLCLCPLSCTRKRCSGCTRL